MKKNLYKIRFTLALFVAMLFGATNVQAQTTYDLWIWGTQVTEANCGNLAPLADATEGTMTYSNSTKTLTLDNVKIDKSGSINSINIIRSSIDGLKIEVVGENELKNNGWSLIDINKNTTIQGSGTLNIVNTNSDNFGIYVSASATLTIKDCNVNIISPGGAIHGLNNESLVFDNAFVKAKGSKNGSIYGFANITFTNCVISKPAGAKVYNRAICYADGSRIKDTVKIIPPYNLKIWDTPVTEDNCGDLAPLAGVTSGAMTYNNSTKTLTLDNVNIDKSASTNFINIIRSSIDGLKIEVVGENNLKNNGWSLIDIDKNTTIQGSGTLNIENTRIHDCVINATTSATLTIKDCKVNITCSGGGIRGDSNGDIVFDNAFVTAKGTNSGSIYGFKNITFVDCGIAKPVGAKVYNKAICDAGGNIIKDTVKILPGSYYALWIWDTPVTEDNCGNLAAVAGATDGTMTYNNSTKTLTIDNLKIDTVGNKNIIKSCIDGLKIEVIGENSLKNNGWSLIDVESNTTIQGSGILNIENSSNDIGININVSDTLKIKDCYLNVTCPGNGIRGGGNAYLIFDNATVTARGTNSGSIVGFKNITFVDCGIAKPTGAVFNTLKKAICDVEGNIIKDTVKIELGIVNNYYDLWIWGKQVTEDNCGDLATVAGASEGSITYNNLTKTLKLENVKIDRTGNKNIIRSSIDGLKIEVVGKNNLKNHGWSLI
ncbi:MAG: hypothetical protein GX259_01095, partial [Bacteroidales bacterium]|nr:hypothetical protein [Bacteroidales bacterium]